MARRYAPLVLLLGLLILEIASLRGFRQSLQDGAFSWHDLELQDGRVTLQLIASARLLLRAHQGASFAGYNTAEDFGLEGLLSLLTGWAALCALLVCLLSIRHRRIWGRWFTLRVLILCALACAPLLLSGVLSTLKALAGHKPRTKLIRCVIHGKNGQPQFQLGPERLSARAVMNRLKSGEPLRFLNRGGQRVPLVFGFSKLGNEMFGAQGQTPWSIEEMDVQLCASP